MKKDKLKPYVYKVEGAVNFAFYDMLKGIFYQIRPEGSVEEIRKYLLEEGLIFETEGIVPNMIISQELKEIQDNINIRVLQIRLNGRGEDNCWNRIKKNRKNNYIKEETLNKLQVDCRYIPIQKIRIEAEENDKDKIKKIFKEFKFKKVEIFIEKGVERHQMEQYKKICGTGNITFLKDGKKDINKLKVEISNFFYSKYYNPCLGHQVAIDTGGEIKCCLWSDEILGNISSDNLKYMIVMGKFDKYWELSKIKIDTCKDCELKHACDDCRVSAVKESGDWKSKPGYCKYNPYTGK